MLPFGLQPIHIAFIILVGFLIFGGAAKLPELGRSLGKTLTEFRKGTKEAAESFKEEMQKPVDASAATPPAASMPVQAPTAIPNPSPSMPVQAPVQPTGNFCINCGAPNLPEARFCANCGTKLPEKMV